MYTIGGNVNCYSHYGKQYGVSSEKLKIDLHMIQQFYSGCISKVNEDRILKRYMHSHVFCGIIHNNQLWKQLASANSWMDKEAVVYIQWNIIQSWVRRKFYHLWDCKWTSHLFWDKSDQNKYCVPSLMCVIEISWTE